MIIDIISSTNSLYEIGLVDNHFKSEISSINYRKHRLTKVKQDVQTSLYDVKERKTADSTILDFPIDFAILRLHLDESCSHIELLAQCLNTIQPQQGLFLFNKYSTALQVCLDSDLPNTQNCYSTQHGEEQVETLAL